MTFQQGVNPKYRPLLIAMLGIIVAVLVNWLTNLYSPDWLKDYFGEDYKMIILLFTVLCVLFLLLLTHQQENSTSTSTSSSNAPNYNIAPTKAHREALQQARKFVEKAKLDEALHTLSDMRLPEVSEMVSVLSARWAKYKRGDFQGVLSFEQKDTTANRIIKDILTFITVLETEMKTSAGFDASIKTYLTERYALRLSQKLANRQPVNLRRLPTTEGTSEETSAAFVPYGDDEIKAHIAQTFKDAHGRLLITGVPGAGKTTLLLQLTASLLQSEPDALPVLLNLATWKKEYITLDTWLKEILPTELGVSKALAARILAQERLILLLDGLDEVRKNDRESCLTAMGRYGEVAQRQYTVTSRIQEYKNVSKDAPVYLQIEVGDLTIEQIEAELTRVGYTQPEAKPLLQALRADALLREAAQVPFYFNTLQLLFAGGKRLSDLNFKGTTLAERQGEITEQFVAHELNALTGKSYTPQQAQKYLSLLALNMNRLNKVVFELTELQYDWCVLIRRELFVGSFINGLVDLILVVLLGVLFGVLLGGLFVGLLVGLLVVLLIGLVSGFFVETSFIATHDNVKWSFSHYFNAIKKNLENSLIVGLFIGLVVVIVVGFVVNFLTSLVVGLAVVLIVVLSVSFNFYLRVNNSGLIQIKEPYQRFKASARVLHFSIIQHYHLLYLLDKKGHLPFKLVSFLNDMTKQKFLESDGITWRFRHRLLQDFFVEKYEINGDDFMGYIGKGKFYSDNNQNDKALESYSKAFDIQPNKPNDLNSVGFNLICAGGVKSSEQFLFKAIELGNVIYGNMNLGHVYLCKSEKEKALECYKKSLDAVENKQYFWEGMADDLQYLTQYGITEAYYQGVLEELKQM
jgi:tetratricopeptide (TPR) repeat protein